MRKALCLVMALAISPAMAAPKLSDSQISQELIGSWIIPPDSPDFEPLAAYALEVMRPDGTYEGYLFRDTACQEIAGQFRAKWRVEKGVVINTTEKGKVTRSEVVSIGNGKATFRSLDHKIIYTRIKALTCSKAMTS